MRGPYKYGNMQNSDVTPDKEHEHVAMRNAFLCDHVRTGVTIFQYLSSI